MSKSYHFPQACFTRGGLHLDTLTPVLQFWDTSVYTYDLVPRALWQQLARRLPCEGCWFNEFWRFNPDVAYQKIDGLPNDLTDQFLWLQWDKRYALLGWS